MERYTKSVTFATIAATLVFAAAATAMTLTLQPAKATVGPCSACAKDFAPGIEAQFPFPYVFSITTE